MKRFHFPLARVRQWRENQVMQEEHRLEQLLVEHNTLESRRQAQVDAWNSEESAVVGAASTDAAMLHALAGYRSFARNQLAALARELTGCDNRIAEQRHRLAEAQRKVRLLEKLEHRRRQAWDAALNREIEDLAAESDRARRFAEAAEHT